MSSIRNITISLNKRNKDIKELLDKYKENDKNFIVSDYACEAIRFYEKYNKSINNHVFNNDKSIQDIIIKMLTDENNKLNPVFNVFIDNKIKEILKNSELYKEVEHTPTKVFEANGLNKNSNLLEEE